MSISAIKIIYKVSFSALLLLISIPSVQAQYSISGKVLDGSSAAVPYANVLLLNAKDSSLIRGSVSDTSGYYELERITTGKYLLSAQAVGYQSYFSKVFDLAQDLTFEELIIQEAMTELGEVVVKALRPLMEVTPNALVVNVESSPILQNGNALELLEKSPGVVVDQDGNISVKGKSNVLVYLDGKQTYLSDTDLAQLLESTTANNIAKIEIMDNPPAKYDAEGNAGIINIVRKKSVDQGLNGRVSLGLGYGRYPKANPGLTLNYRSEIVNLFGSYNYNYNRRFQNNNIYRLIPTQNEQGEPVNTIFDQYSSQVSINNNHNFRTGADWFINKNTTIGMLVSGNIGSWERDGNNTTFLSGYFTNPYNRLEANNLLDNQWVNMTYNLNFSTKLTDKASLSIDADYANWVKDTEQENNNYFFNAEENSDEPPLLVRTFADTRIEIIAVKADYSGIIFTEWGFEAGAKSSIVRTDNTLDFNTLEEGSLINDTLRSNQFQYEETIHAGYVNLSKKFSEKIAMQVGLRTEYTASRGYSVTLDSTADREYINLFPSASLSYKVNDQHSLSASYSRRIDRPNYGNLNPFEYFLDRFTFERGNPFLNPQYTNAYAVNYNFKNAAFLTFNFNQIKDAITQVLEQDEASQTTFQTTTNLDRQRHYSLNLAAPLPITDWWVMNTNLTAYYNTVESTFSEGNIDKNLFSYMARMQNAFSLPKDYKIELMGMYMSPQLWGMFEIQEMYQVDLGLSKSFGNLKVQGSIDDIFNIRDNNVVIRQGDISTDVANKWESRVYRINLSYTFGSDKIKQARRRGTASDDLRNRAN